MQGLGILGLGTSLLVLVVAFDAAVFHAVPLAARIAAGATGVLLLAALLRGAVTFGAGMSRARARRRWLRRARRVRVDDREILVVEDRRLVACCVGGRSPDIVLSQATLDVLTPEELRAVVAHEAAHAAHRDPLRLLLAAAATESMWFLPGARRMRRRYGDLLERAADEQAALEAGRSSVAAALVAFAQAGGASQPSALRVDGLLGGSPDAAPPVVRCDLALLLVLAAAAAATTWTTGCLDPLGGGAACDASAGAPGIAVAMLALSALLAGHASVTRSTQVRDIS